MAYEGFWWNNEHEKKPFFITRTSITDEGGVCKHIRFPRQLQAGWGPASHTDLV